jgi:hypothetical protein
MTRMSGPTATAGGKSEKRGGRNLVMVNADDDLQRMVDTR